MVLAVALMCSPFGTAGIQLQAALAEYERELARPVPVAPLPSLVDFLTAPDRCDSCGSSDFFLHHNRYRCSYCRSAA